VLSKYRKICREEINTHVHTNERNYKARPSLEMEAGLESGGSVIKNRAHRLIAYKNHGMKFVNS